MIAAGFVTGLMHTDANALVLDGFGTPCAGPWLGLGLCLSGRAIGSEGGGVFVRGNEGGGVFALGIGGGGGFGVLSITVEGGALNATVDGGDEACFGRGHGASGCHGGPVISVFVSQSALFGADM